MQRNCLQILVQIAAKENNDELVKSLLIKKGETEGEQSVLSFIFSKLCNIFNGMFLKKKYEIRQRKVLIFS